MEILGITVNSDCECAIFFEKKNLLIKCLEKNNGNISATTIQLLLNSGIQLDLTTMYLL